MKNFCIKIEHRYIDHEGELIVSTLLFELVDLRKDYKADILHFLYSHENLILKLNIVIIEAQVNRNVKMVKMQEYIESLFRFHIYNIPKSKLKIVRVMKASLKYSTFSIDTKSMTKYKRKTVVSPRVAMTICDKYLQYEDIHLIETSNKKDDYSDTTIMIEVFFRTQDKNCRFFDHFEVW